MKKAISLIFIIFTLTGCHLLNPPVKNEPSNSEEMNYSFLAMGDSYTIGEGVEEEESWPVQLVERLRRRDFKMAYPKIVARTGWTTSDLIREVEEEIDVHRNFDLVSILIGVNNQYQKKSLSDFEEELREIFRKAINHSKRRERGVFAMSIPDYGVTPFGTENADQIGRDINEFNRVIRKVADEYDIDFFYITPISREAATNPQLIAADSLHPSKVMYRYWVDEIIDEVAIKLPRRVQ